MSVSVSRSLCLSVRAGTSAVRGFGGRTTESKKGRKRGMASASMDICQDDDGVLTGIMVLAQTNDIGGVDEGERPVDSHWTGAVAGGHQAAIRV